ncbi:MAG: PfkB family carbohydrate kinase, partial [Candidatus Bipolaricaulota bacterium]
VSGEEDPGAEILSRGVKALVITRGGEGAEFISGERHFSVPGFEVEVEDTTAAGDAFAGALAVGLAEGIEVEKIVEFANAAGALAAGSSGAQPSLPDRTRTIEFLEERTDGSYLKGGE